LYLADKKLQIKIMNCKKISFSGHVILQMFKRQITEEEIIEVISTGKIIKNYPEDKPFPSFLILGTIKKRALHVVVAKDNKSYCIVITAYEPDKEIWSNDFSTKIK
jgi:hypothetical protein